MSCGGSLIIEDVQGQPCFVKLSPNLSIFWNVARTQTIHHIQNKRIKPAHPELYPVSHMRISHRLSWDEDVLITKILFQYRVQVYFFPRAIFPWCFVSTWQSGFESFNGTLSYLAYTNSKEWDLELVNHLLQ